MIWRVKAKKNLIFRLSTIIGSLGSILAATIPGLLEEGDFVWWKLTLLAVGVLLTGVAIWLAIKAEHTTRSFRIGADVDIGNYLFRWIKTGGRVLICTRDMSWAAESRMMRLLEAKARSGELTIVLPEEVARSNELKSAGAEIVVYGDLHRLATHFTVVNYEHPGSRVAIGWRSGDRHLIQEFSAADEDPTFYLALDVVRLARGMNYATER